MTADRDDLAAILAKHHTLRPSGIFNGVVCRCKERPPMDVPDGWRYHEDDIPDEIYAWHTAHQAQMVLESDWLRERDAAKWDEARMAVLSGFVPESEHEFLSLYPNPYRADRVDAEDGGR